MDNENKTIPQPFDVVEKLREAIRLLGLEVHGFDSDGPFINLKLGTPLNYPPGFPVDGMGAWGRLINQGTPNQQ